MNDDCSSRQRGRHNVTALAYDRKGRLLSVGKNSYEKTHPLQGFYGRRAGEPDKIYLHAEMSAMIKARGQVHKLVVMRYHRDGSPANSKPCKTCQLAIKDFGVKVVQHT